MGVVVCDTAIAPPRQLGLFGVTHERPASDSFHSRARVVEKCHSRVTLSHFRIRPIFHVGDIVFHLLTATYHTNASLYVGFVQRRAPKHRYAEHKTFRSYKAPVVKTVPGEYLASLKRVRHALDWRPREPHHPLHVRTGNSVQRPAVSYAPLPAHVNTCASSSTAPSALDVVRPMSPHLRGVSCHQRHWAAAAAARRTEGRSHPRSTTLQVDRHQLRVSTTTTQA
jgi:hypothetical protein